MPVSEEAKVWGLIMEGTVGCPRVNSATRYKKKCLGLVFLDVQRKYLRSKIYVLKSHKDTER